MKVHKSGTSCFFMSIPIIKYSVLNDKRPKALISDHPCTVFTARMFLFRYIFLSRISCIKLYALK